MQKERQDRRKRIVEAISAGRPLREIAVEYGVSRERIRQIGCRAGIDQEEAKRKRLEAQRRSNKADCGIEWEEVRAAVQEAGGLKGAAEKLGINRYRLVTWWPESVPMAEALQRARHGDPRIRGEALDQAVAWRKAGMSWEAILQAVVERWGEIWRTERSMQSATVKHARKTGQVLPQEKVRRDPLRAKRAMALREEGWDWKGNYQDNLTRRI